MTTIQYIDNDDALATFCDSINSADFIAVDTEFVREKTYFPGLCLIQVATHEQLACIDPLTIEDFEPMLALFRDESVTKVLHSVSQDMEVFLYRFNCLPRPVYDTQIAASLTGMGEQVAYARLVQEMLGVKLDKSHTRTDWSRRPLDQAQIQYAADDVRYLAELYPVQRQQLEEQGRLEWLASDFAAIVEEDRYRPDPENVWLRVKGRKRLKGVELAILKQLAQYREQQAVQADRPRRFILSDDLLMDLARSQPKTIADIERRRGFVHGLVKRHGEAFLECVRKGQQVPRDQWPEVNDGKPLTSSQEVITDMLMALLKQQAKRNQVSVASLASRKEVEKLVRGKRDIALLSGWRHELAGKALLEFLNGETSIKINDHQLLLG